MQNRQVAEREKVELQQSQFRHGVHVVLRDNRSVAQRQRHVLRHALIGNDDARRVNRDVARHSLKGHGGVDQLFHAFGAFVQFLQLGQSERHGQRDVRLLRHCARNCVHVAIGHSERPPDVAHGGSGGKRTEGDDLRNMILPVAPPDIVDHLVAAVIAEVHVDIGHTHALGVEEALEEQIEAERVDIGNAECERDKASRARSSAGSYGDVLRPCIIDVVLHDQEVVLVPHLQNDRQLIFQSLAVLALRMLRKGDMPLFHALRKACFGALAKEGLRALFVGTREFRQVGGIEIEADLAPFGDPAGIFQCLRVRLEGHGHFVGVLEVELVGCERGGSTHIGGGIGLDAHEDCLRVGIPAAQVVAVVGGDQRQVTVLCEVDQHGKHGTLFRESVILNFDIEMLRTEDFGIAQCGLFCAFIVPLCKLFRNLSAKAGGQGDQPAMVAAQKFLVHAGFIIKAFGKGSGDHFRKVSVAFVILAEEDKVVCVAVCACGFFKSGGMRDVDLAPDDGFDARVPARLPECDRAVHHAMVGNCHCLLSALLHSRGDVRDSARAVQQAIFAMQVQCTNPFIHPPCKTSGLCPEPYLENF